MKFEDVMLIMDLDGTLLASEGERSYLSKENETFIRRFIEGGGTFSIATGRGPQNGYHPVAHLPINFPLHLVNGALTLSHLDYAEKLDALYLDDDFFSEAIAYYKQDEKVSLVVVDDHGVHGLSHNGIVESDHGFRYQPLPVEDLRRENIYKIAFIAEESVCDALEKSLGHFIHADRTGLVRSLPRYLEALHVHANKGRAIRKTMKALGYNDKTLVCVGDQMNDATMLDTADLALVPANANEKLKRRYKTLPKNYNETLMEDILDIIRER